MYCVWLSYERLLDMFVCPVHVEYISITGGGLASQ